MTQERFAVGSILGTGAAINVHLGFIPRFVQCWNVSDTKLPKLVWFKGMAAAAGYKEAIGTTYLAPSVLSSLGITAYAGTDAAGDSAGFTLGADTDINGSGDTIYYIAER